MPHCKGGISLDKRVKFYHNRAVLADKRAVKNILIRYYNNYHPAEMN
jgi:hypothetical protein